MPMKKILFLVGILCCTAFVYGQQLPSQPDSTKSILTVEASCGTCQLKMEGDDCALAIRMGDKTYYVEGTSIDAHGDAHDKDGFCNKIRKAQVQGELVNNRYKVTWFKLLPLNSTAPKP